LSQPAPVSPTAVLNTVSAVANSIIVSLSITTDDSGTSDSTDVTT